MFETENLHQPRISPDFAGFRRTARGPAFADLGGLLQLLLEALALGIRRAPQSERLEGWYRPLPFIYPGFEHVAHVRRLEIGLVRRSWYERFSFLSIGEPSQPKKWGEKGHLADRANSYLSLSFSIYNHAILSTHSHITQYRAQSDTHTHTHIKKQQHNHTHIHTPAHTQSTNTHTVTLHRNSLPICFWYQHIYIYTYMYIDK